ncbi:MAG: tRNA(His) guanylyltransferase Thg1 family protein [Candidatus Bathyarchaeia archaeon]
MQESSSNRYKDLLSREIYAKTLVSLELPFFVRLDGWKFRKLSEAIGSEKPFDETFAKCLIYSGGALFNTGFSPALIYFASDEINILFISPLPFRGRVEKIDSVIPSLVSTAFTLCLHKLFNKSVIAAFDSRIVLTVNDKEIVEYLAWRQMNAWRNHNNAYAYWVFRKMGYKPSEIAKMLKGMKAEETHETVFRSGVNLAQTPLWQRRGILLYKQPCCKKVANKSVIRWRLNEDWNLPLFSSEEGAKLIQQILEWVRQKRRG